MNPNLTPRPWASASAPASAYHRVSKSMSSIFKARRFVFKTRTIAASIAAITLAGLLYTYSVTSIRAAKRNAQLHREADGGQLDMRRESLRRHGALERVPRTGGVTLFRDIGAKGEEARARVRAARAESANMGEKRARSLGEEGGLDGGVGTGIERDVGRGPRTTVEGRLEDYKGRGRAVEKFREERPEMPAE